MKKHEFLTVVTKVISDNPEWAGDLHIAITEGLKMSLDIEQEKRHDAETALAMCYDYTNHKKLPEVYKEKIVKVIKDSSAFKGTEYAERL